MEAAVTCILCNSLGSIDENLLSNTDEAKKNHARVHFTQSKILDDGITEDEIFLRCFAIRQPKVERPALSKSECRKSLLVLCKSLVSAQAACNLCGTSAKRDKHGMLDHACAHLEVKLFKCRYCDSVSSRSRAMLLHLQQKHNINNPTNENFEDKTVEHFDMISDRIKHCFSSSFPRAFGPKRQLLVRMGCRDKSHRAVVHLCRSVFVQRHKPTALDCNLCGSRIILRSRVFQASHMFKHAAAHLEDKLFKCRHCNRSMSSKSSMREHLRKCHQMLDRKSNDFDDQSEKFHLEHLNMIERCFSADQVKLVEEPTNGKSMVYVKAVVRRYPEPGSKLTMTRHLLSNRLIKMKVDSEGKIKCSICSKRLAAMNSGHAFSQVALSHAEMHLQKPLYRCKVCKSSFCTRPIVSDHLKKKHALRMEKNHECVADEFHEEIMDMLSKCYATEGL